jgi:hypothetical protein
MKSEKISELTTSRLSVYLRCLNLLAAAGIKTISSQALADQFRLNSAQIRKGSGKTWRTSASSGRAASATRWASCAAT